VGESSFTLAGLGGSQDDVSLGSFFPLGVITIRC